jgi:hypothetical protein
MMILDSDHFSEFGGEEFDHYPICDCSRPPALCRSGRSLVGYSLSRAPLASRPRGSSPWGDHWNAEDRSASRVIAPSAQGQWSRELLKWDGSRPVSAPLGQAQWSRSLNAEAILFVIEWANELHSHVGLNPGQTCQTRRGEECL